MSSERSKSNTVRAEVGTLRSDQVQWDPCQVSDSGEFFPPRAELFLAILTSRLTEARSTEPGRLGKI